MTELFIYFTYYLASASLSLHRFAADVRRFEEHLQHEAEERLQTMVSHFNIDPSRIKPHVRFGSVRDEVNELAKELECRCSGYRFA